MSVVKLLFPRWARLGRETRPSPGLLHEQRRATRVAATMPILLYGRMGNEPFQEQTETIDVSTHGGLVPIEAEVTRWQKLILTNVQTNEELACRVARVIHTEKGIRLAGLEFLQPSQRFWGSVVPIHNGYTGVRKNT